MTRTLPTASPVSWIARTERAAYDLITWRTTSSSLGLRMLASDMGTGRGCAVGVVVLDRQSWP